MLVGHFLIVGLAAWAAATCFALVTGEASAQSFLTRTGTFSVSDAGQAQRRIRHARHDSAAGYLAARPCIPRDLL